MTTLIDEIFKKRQEEIALAERRNSWKQAAKLTAGLVLCAGITLGISEAYSAGYLGKKEPKYTPRTEESKILISNGKITELANYNPNLGRYNQ